MQHSLLQARNARKDSRGHAFFRPTDAVCASRRRDSPCDRNSTRKETIGENAVTIKRMIFLIVGCVSLALGCTGIVLPILPTVPFFLLTVFCFANSSQKLHDWFIGTRMYKKHLESFVQKKGMTIRAKVTILSSVTLLMGLGFALMLRKGLWIPCTILGVIWICHLIYFLLGVKTLRAED